MEKQPLHQRLATLREAARRREEEIRMRMEWVETRQRELWSRLDRQAEPPVPAPAEPAPRLRFQPAEPVRQPRLPQVRQERRQYEMRGPSLAPRPAEVLLAQFRDILIDVAAAMQDSGNPEAEADRSAADPSPALASAEP